MAKILNYQNYHKITVAQHRHPRHHRQPETQQQQHPQQQQHFEQLVQRQPATANQGKTLQTNATENIFYTTQLQLQQTPQHVAQHQQHVVLQHHCKIKQNKNPHNHNNNNSIAQLTSIDAAKQQQCSNHHSHHLHKSNSKHNQSPATSQQTYSSASSSSTSASCSSASASASSSLAPVSAASSSSLSPSSLLSSSATLPASALYSTYTTTCCVLTYNLFAACAEAATLQLKRKTSFNKFFYASGRRHHHHHTDMSSICYLILMAFVYWGVMIRAAVATNLTTATASTSTSSTTTIAATTTATTTIMPLAELSSNLTLNGGRVGAGGGVAGVSIVTYGHGHGSTSLSHYNSKNNNTKNNNSLRPHLPISSVSSDILTNYQRRLLTRREAANVPDFEDDDSSYHDDEFDEYEALIRNKSAKGKYIGAPCNNMSCEPTLLHVTCDKETQICGCERNYPVQLGLTRGCDKPKKLGEQCFYDETCQYNDENSLCVQVRHNAMCQCANGFHSVSYNKPTRRVFCTQDLDELNSDLPTLLGVCVGIGVLAGLICMVLHLFSKTKYPRHRNFGDANLPPPIMYSSETGIPLTVQSGRPSSRSSIRSSGGSIGSYGNRRSSTGGVTATTAGSKGILVSTSRTGSRRPSLASVHSTSSSVRSYSMMRFEKEQQQKEIRHEMKLRLARLQQHQHQQHLGHYKPQIIIGDTALTMQQHGVALNRITMATPSPMTPNSTDELLPAVDETQEYPPMLESLSKPCPESVASATLSAIKNAAAASSGATPKLTSTTNNMATATAAAAAAAATAAAAAATTTDMANAAAYIGPCSSSTEAL